jgi:two-component system nitrogen regulation response regulator GlnG
MPILLLVDDEPSVLYAMEKGLRTEGLTILCKETAHSAIDCVRTQRPDAVICDVRLPDMSGLDVVQQMRAIDPRLPVIIITAHAATETAIEAMKRGAFDYLLKPYELPELQQVVARALELSRIQRVPAVFDQSPVSEADESPSDRIIGVSRGMQEAYKEIGRVAPQNVNVLILGESGTGKELVARAIYQHSTRADQPFLAVNCAAIPELLLESELFGHEKGAFTGSDRRRIGKFEQASAGTLFLDEIGDMSPSAQAKILRVLQDGRFERVGGTEVLQSDVRIIAATNIDLQEAIAKKLFREDLFYRLNTFTIRLPALRDRLEDLPLLVDHFVFKLGQQLGRTKLRASPEFMRRLLEHTWPGNVRELQSAIKYSIVRSTSEVITPDCLPAFVSPNNPGDDRSLLSPGSGHETFSDLRQLIQQMLESGQRDLNEAVHSEVDRLLYAEVLNYVGGHLSQASEVLGISRTTFRTRLQGLGMTVEKALKLAED